LSRFPDLKTLRILYYPDPRLRVEAAPVVKVDSLIGEMADRMRELMAEAHGLGLAATQVGWPFRLVILNTGGESEKVEVFVNPVILSRRGRILEEEGCLSVPGLYARVRRAERVHVRAIRLDGEVVEMDAEGLLARAWQHEVDHLDGRLFVDRLGPAARIALGPRLREMEERFRSGSDYSGDGEPDASEPGAM